MNIKYCIYWGTTQYLVKWSITLTDFSQAGICWYSCLLCHRFACWTGAGPGRDGVESLWEWMFSYSDILCHMAGQDRIWSSKGDVIFSFSLWLLDNIFVSERLSVVVMDSESGQPKCLFGLRAAFFSFVSEENVWAEKNPIKYHHEVDCESTWW